MRHHIYIETQSLTKFIYSNNGTFTCAGAAKNANFCAGTSLSSNIIIRCTAGVGQPGNCNDNLAGLDPIGVKSNALCYQSTDVAGDAACSFNGTAYPDSGTPYKIGGSSSASSAPSSYATASTSSVAPPVSYTTSASVVTTASVTKPVTYSVPSASATASKTASVTPPVYTGAANSVKGGAAAVVMAAAAAVAFL